MQKTALKTLVREEVIRAFVFSVSFILITSVGFVWVAHAASGGKFGDILNAILASGNWESPGDGTVKNAEKLGGAVATDYVRVKAWQSCGAGKCVTGFDPDGTVKCTP
jgi:hypothetical protein